jgi:aromatic-L-amino-acid/L-tryptophan decarboxylase
MKPADYGPWARRAVAWGERYLATLRDRPVRARTTPGATAARLPARAPEAPEPLDAIFADFEAIVPDAMTHWQHPRFFAYFPANAAPVSMVAEILTATMAAQCMLWQTSPAATEIEAAWSSGWPPPSASRASPARSRRAPPPPPSPPCSPCASAPSAGPATSMASPASPRSASTPPPRGIPRSTRRCASPASARPTSSRSRPAPTTAWTPPPSPRPIAADRDAGLRPAGVVLCVGGTSTGATDPIAACLAVAKAHGLYTHVDAAWAGSAMICPELRPLWAGVEEADSIVMNPHKWLGAQFDCSIQFLRDPGPQIRTLALRPDYLATPGHADVTNYSEWTLPLGRRFRALKLWFLLRAHGLEDLRARIRNHIAWSRALHDALAADPAFEIATPLRLSLFTFRWTPPGRDPDAATPRLARAINDAGRIYVTETTVKGRPVIRFQVGQFDCTREDVDAALEAIREAAATS